MNEFISFLLSECNVCQITIVAYLKQSSNDCKMHSFLFSWTYASFQSSTCFSVSRILEEEVMFVWELFACSFVSRPQFSFPFLWPDVWVFSASRECEHTQAQLWKASFSRECIKLEAKLYIFMSPARDSHFSIGTSLFQQSLKIWLSFLYIRESSSG